MDPALASAYQEIAEGHRKIADYYSSLVSSLHASGSSTPAPASTTVSNGSASPARKKLLKDPDAPKRPPTSFLLFCNEMRPSVKAQHPTLNPNEIVRELGVLWKTIDRTKWEEAAKPLSQEYSIKKEAYKRQSSSEEHIPANEAKTETPVASKSPKKQDSKTSDSPVVTDPKKSEKLAESGPVTEVAKSTTDAAVETPKKKKKKSHPTEPAAIPSSTIAAETKESELKKIKKPKKEKVPEAVIPENN